MCGAFQTPEAFGVDLYIDALLSKAYADVFGCCRCLSIRVKAVYLFCYCVMDRAEGMTENES